ncbi:MAG: ACT domain-containing protein [bacterium]|nr:ACT domain-containing protein [bacterium]MDD5354454.1 ACT domain-containing protein [bacterium]MDD5756345.1 ACT domain-containing protein [bacterium]
MKKTIIITAIGKDRPGIVAAVSKVLYETSCNIEDSSMTILGNDFAMILMVALPASVSVSLLDKKMAAVRNKLGLSITLRPLKPTELKAAGSGNAVPCMISVYGTDKPGIVYRISDFLARNKVNITDVETKIISPQQNPVYVMMLEVNVPTPDRLPQVTKALAALAHELHVDITIKPIESYQL